MTSDQLFRSIKAGDIRSAYVFYGPDDIRRLNNIIKYTRSHVIYLEFDEEGHLVEKAKQEL